MRKPRVVITGLGVVAPNGIGQEAFWHALRSGNSGIARITRFDASKFPSQIAGEIKDFQPMSYMTSRQARRMSLVAQYGVAAAKMAVEDADLQITPDNARAIGVGFGTSVGKPESVDTEHPSFLEKGIRAIHPLTLLEFSPPGVTSNIAMVLGTEGVCRTLSSGCSVGLDVVQWGYFELCRGNASAVVVGSAESLLSPYPFGMACATGLLSKHNDVPQHASRPFDLRRDGLVLSEGAAALVLERLEYAQERGAGIYAEVQGYASAREGREFVHSDLDGKCLTRVIEAALYEADLTPQDIDYICAHGVSLPIYDTSETNAIKAAFGKHAYNIPVSSVKSMIGQSFAAGGAFQVAASCLTIKHDLIPPTVNYEVPDPTCDLDYVPNWARRARVRTVLIQARGMGGNDAALVLGKPIF